MTSTPKKESETPVVKPLKLSVNVESRNRSARRKLQYAIDHDAQLFKKEKQENHQKLMAAQRREKVKNRIAKVQARKEERPVKEKTISKKRIKEVAAIKRRQDARRMKEVRYKEKHK